MKKILKYWVPVIGYMSCIAFLSSLSSPEEQIPSFVLPVPDKILHALEYAILGILCFRAFFNAGGVPGTTYAFPLAVITATVFGLSDEYHQSFVPLRQADPLDLLADFLGATLGILMWHGFRWIHPFRPKST